MDRKRQTEAPRVFSVAHWGQATLPLLGLALPGSVFAAAQDDFDFDAQAPEPTLDLIDILPQMVRHFSSTAYHMDRPGLMAGADGSSFVVPPDAQVAQDAADVPLHDQPADDAF